VADSSSKSDRPAPHSVASVADSTAGPQFDVAVIGAGLAGLTSAVRAAELGVRVVLLESGEGDDYPCNARFSGGVFHTSYTDPKKDAAVVRQAINEATNGEADPSLVDTIIHDAPRALDWLRSHGARFIRGTVDWHAWVLAPPRPMSTGLDWRGRGPDVLLKALTRKALELGVVRWNGWRAVELRMRDGACAGLRAERQGQHRDILALSVILADGGFQGNAELFRAHIGPSPERVVQRSAGTGVGDGLKMAIEAGAAVTSLNRFYGHVLSRDALTNPNLWPYPQVDLLAASGIVVDPDGSRMLDEGLGGVYIANELARLDDPASTTVIVDRSIWDGPGKQAQIPPNPMLERAGGTVHEANTLAELAALAGIAPEGLQRTVATYNDAINGGSLDRLQPARSNRKAKAWPIVTAPFRAIPISSGITHTMGGVVIDGQARVLSRDGRAIPGLCAAGTTTGGLEGGSIAGYVGGLIRAATLGLRAGETAAGAVRDITSTSNRLR
jgi:fumarate reductase flavoprotein subunit